MYMYMYIGLWVQARSLQTFSLTLDLGPDCRVLVSSGLDPVFTSEPEVGLDSSGLVFRTDLNLDKRSLVSVGPESSSFMVWFDSSPGLGSFPSCDLRVYFTLRPDASDPDLVFSSNLIPGWGALFSCDPVCRSLVFSDPDLGICSDAGSTGTSLVFELVSVVPIDLDLGFRFLVSPDAGPSFRSEPHLVCSERSFDLDLDFRSLVWSGPKSGFRWDPDTGLTSGPDPDWSSSVCCELDSGWRSGFSGPSNWVCGFWSVLDSVRRSEVDSESRDFTLGFRVLLRSDLDSGFRSAVVDPNCWFWSRRLRSRGSGSCWEGVQVSVQRQKNRIREHLNPNQNLRNWNLLTVEL